VFPGERAHGRRGSGGPPFIVVTNRKVNGEQAREIFAVSLEKWDMERLAFLWQIGDTHDSFR
jgi:hypothetical protein